MTNLLFIIIFITVLFLFFRIFGWIGHLFKLDNFIYSPSDHGFIKKGSGSTPIKKTKAPIKPPEKKELISS